MIVQERAGEAVLHRPPAKAATGPRIPARAMSRGRGLLPVWKRAGAAGACIAAMCSLRMAPAQARPRDIEIDLRDSSYVFAVPSAYLGPFNSEKLDVIASGENDVLFLHAVTTNRIDPAGGAHGEFVRIEDDHRFGSSRVRLAAGVGGGVLGQRSATLAFAQPVSPDRRFTLSAAVDLTALSTVNYQRVVGVGPEVAVGRVSVFARYYHATTTKPTGAPPSASVLASAPVAGSLGFAVAANFGGELNADRTSGFLPTSSGRFGTDLALTARVGIGPRINMLAGYEGAAYRAPPGGEVARLQHIVTLGVAFGPFH